MTPISPCHQCPSPLMVNQEAGTTSGSQVCADAEPVMILNGLQVALLPSAVNAEGSGKAASVSAAAGNKARVKEGLGTFKDVRLSADQAGSYILRAKPSSRKVRPNRRLGTPQSHRCPWQMGHMCHREVFWYSSFL